MNTFLKLAFLFYIGSSLGWVLELFFRRFISGNNPERKWINPGFMVGPYVPLYGTGLCILYLVSRLSESRQIANPVWNHIAMLVLMAAAMTAIEYIAGILLLKVMNARLWDYSRRWGNVNGLISPPVFRHLGSDGRGLLFLCGSLHFAGTGLAFPQFGVFLCHRRVFRRFRHRFRLFHPPHGQDKDLCPREECGGPL